MKAIPRSVVGNLSRAAGQKHTARYGGSY